MTVVAISSNVYSVFHNYQVNMILHLFPIPYSLRPTPCSLLPTPYS
ncbi:MAG: hypothetical protein F6J98_21600 [Moorea sp. SIO4G2]|nr:hypothetical protein [Moorena producens]NEO62890.1 hypothetical protein [Moorena sp. SIO4G2]